MTVKGLRKVKHLIVGAGPCGLGAAWRLQELAQNDFLILEASDRPGGLATSFVDENGFVWDIGGHVQFSHYADFDRVMDLLLPNQWLVHQRESWIWMEDRFIPYPFQTNLWRLPEEKRNACLQGLELQKNIQSFPKNFREWISSSFGSGISDLFMLPYNFKVWAHPPEIMSYQWIGERVATVDLEKVKKLVAEKRDDISWGPNSVFRFPLHGGTGAIWRALASKIDQNKICLQSEMVKIDAEQKLVTLKSGQQFAYDNLLSTMPLDRLSQLVGLKLKAPLMASHSWIFGLGFEGQKPSDLKTKCWMYFPESQFPFYRVTVFSNYSPHNVPDSTRHWSLMCEVSESGFKPVNHDTIQKEVLEGIQKLNWLKNSKLISQWQYTARPGYPTPTLERDEIVADAMASLEASNIYSRGRFGAWKYEVSNQDHTFMQGFEWADFIVRGIPELTVNDPAKANAPGKRDLR